jgi:hypothetical protein
MRDKKKRERELALMTTCSLLRVTVIESELNTEIG